MARNGLTKVIYKGTFISDQSLGQQVSLKGHVRFEKKKNRPFFTMICKPKMVISRVKILVHLFSLFQTVCDCSTSFKDKQQKSKRSFKKNLSCDNFSSIILDDRDSYFRVSPKFQVVVYQIKLLFEVNCNTVCSEKKNTKHSSDTLLHMVFFFRNRR